MSEIVLPLTMVAFIANVGLFIDTFDLLYLPPIGISIYIFKLIANGET